MLKTKLFSVAFLVMVLNCVSSVVFANNEEAPTPSTSLEQKVKIEEAASVPQIPKFKASASSYYYDFEGTKAAKGDLYSFGNTTLFLQLFSLQYQVNPNWTLMVMGQHIDNFVVTKMFGKTYEDTSKGFGDTLVSGIRPLYLRGSLMVLGDVGVSLPTGETAIKNQNNTKVNYPYNMQMGSGTFDAVLGITPLWITPTYQLGARLTSYIRTGENAQGYRLGNLYRLDVWADYPLKYGFTPRVVGYYKHKNAIVGQDETFGRSVLTEFYHHTQINWDLSLALKYQVAVLGPSLSLAVEAGVPVAQDSYNYDDVVVSTQYYGSLSFNGAF